MNYLITGGKGFIGSHLANRIIQYKKNKVFVLDNLSNPCNNFLNNQIKCFYGDVSDFEFLKKIIIKFRIDIIYHLSATINESQAQEYTFDDIKNSVTSTLNILEILKKYPKVKLIFGSSISVYGKSNGIIFNEGSTLRPEFSYSICKRTAENYITYYSKFYNLDTAIIRIGNVYGPYQPKIGEVGVINIFIKNFFNKTPLKIYGHGNQMRDFIYIDDVINFLLSKKKINGIFNLVTGSSHSINQIVSILSKYFYYPKKIKKKERIEEIGKLRISSKKAKNLGWIPTVSLKEGLIKTIKFYEKHKELL